MNQLQYSALVYILTSALLVWLYVEWKKYRIDKFRYKLFRIRDNLFMQAKAGSISFDDEAYKMARATLNGMIRFSHELSLFSLLLSKRLRKLPAHRARASEYRNRLDRAHKSLTPEAQEAVDNAMRAMHHVAMEHIAFQSLSAIVITGTLFIWFVLDAFAKKLFGSTQPISIETSQPYETVSKRIDVLGAEISDVSYCAA